MDFQASSLEEMKPIAQAIIARLSESPIVLLIGPMGSGKTSLVRLIMEEAGVTGEVSSPTYSIVQRYECMRGSFYHFDLYRLNNQDELLDLGFEEYLDSGTPCLIEWPEIALHLLPDQRTTVTIKVSGEQRSVHLEP